MNSDGPAVEGGENAGRLPVAGDLARGLALGLRSTERPADAGATLIAGLSGAPSTVLDGGGAVGPIGARWSVDWWIGADDRWYLPAAEAAVRQRRIGHGPIVETTVRIPSGDAVHTAYPAAAGGTTVTVVEVRNDSPVPVALGVAIRPLPVTQPTVYQPTVYQPTVYQPTVDGSRHGGDRFDGGTSASPGHGSLDLQGSVVMIDGRPAVMLPRAPSEAGASPETDILAAVRGGEPLKWDGPVSGSSATAVCLFPLPHGSTLRFVVVSPSVVVDSSRFDVAALPDSAAVSRGWTAAVDTAGRYRFPDDGVHRLAGAARARLIVEADGLGDRVVTGAEGAGIVLRGLAAGGHATECLPVLATFAQSFPTRLVGSPSGAADILAGIAAGAAVVDSSELTDALLEPAAQLAKLIERSGHGPSRFTAYSALAALAAQAGQAEAVADLVGRADAVAPPKSSPPTLDELTACAQAAAPAGRWQSADNPATGQRGGADDAGMAARFWLLARRMLLEETESAVVGGGVHVELLAGFPTAWRGGTVEVHGAPVADHRLSYAIRWHGHRPALLWEVTAGRSTPPPVLRCRSLDPDWVGDELSGETLLGGTADELPKAPEVGDSFQ